MVEPEHDPTILLSSTKKPATMSSIVVNETDLQQLLVCSNIMLKVKYIKSTEIQCYRPSVTG